MDELARFERFLTERTRGLPTVSTPNGDVPLRQMMDEFREMEKRLRGARERSREMHTPFRRYL